MSNLGDMLTTTGDVRFWHKADIAAVVIDVCFWGEADIPQTSENVR